MLATTASMTSRAERRGASFWEGMRDEDMEYGWALPRTLLPGSLGCQWIRAAHFAGVKPLLQGVAAVQPSGYPPSPCYRSRASASDKRDGFGRVVCVSLWLRLSRWPAFHVREPQRRQRWCRNLAGFS